MDLIMAVRNIKYIAERKGIPFGELERPVSGHTGNGKGVAAQR